MLKVIHAAKGVHNQICRQINLKYSFITLRDHVYPFCSFSVKNYYNTIGTTTAKNTLQTNHVRYFGSASRVNASWVEKLNLPEESSSFKKIVKNGCLYMSSVKNNKRSDNSYAQLQNGLYVKINHFIVHLETVTEYTIVQKVLTTNAYSNACGMLQRIVKIVNEHGKKKSIKFYKTSPIVEDTTGSLLKAKIFLVLHYIELFYEMCYKVL